jgi:Membrane-associated phospholipid phosphatase
VQGAFITQGIFRNLQSASNRMKKILSPLFLIAFSLSSHSGYCQYTELSTVNKHDSLPPNINWNTPTVKRTFPYKSFILPSAMVAYGIFSLQHNELSSVNDKVKEEVYTERVSKQGTTIDNILPFIPVVAVYGLNAMGIEGKNNFRDRTMILGLSGLIMGGTVFAVKSFSNETRPDGSDQYSFPSGHTAAAFATAEFMRQEYKDVSPWYGVGAYAMAAATGYLRVYNNKHWAGDVVAGAGIGIMSTRLAYWIYPVIKRSLFKDKPMNTIVMPTYQNGSFGFGLVHHF